MKTKIAALIIFCFCLSCGNDDRPKDDNPYFETPLVNLNLSLNLPEYNPLRFPGNHIVLNSQGVKGIVVYCINETTYSAFDLTDPNHSPSGCSKMTLEGVIASCPCPDDSNEYDIITGQHTADENKYPMQRYFVQRSGDNIQIRN